MPLPRSFQAMELADKANRHCERSEAIQSFTRRAWIVSALRASQ
jgi:hypothetical protein